MTPTQTNALSFGGKSFKLKPYTFEVGWLPPKWAIEWSLGILTYQAGLLRFLCAKVVVESNCWTRHWRLAVYLEFVCCWVSYFCRYFFLKEGVLARTCPHMHGVGCPNDEISRASRAWCLLWCSGAACSKCCTETQQLKSDNGRSL